MEGLAHQLGQAPRIVDLRHPFRERAEHAPVIHFLECLALGLVARHLADEEDHRRRILERGMDADRGVGGAGSAGDEADAGLAGELAVALRHVGGAAFLPAGDDADAALRAVQRIERREIALARHAEHVIDAVDQQLVDQDLAAGPQIVACSPCCAA